MEYLTLHEVKDLLNMPARVIEKLSLHRCEEGYAKEVVERFAKRHRIPSPWHVDVIAVDHASDIWRDASSWGQALWWADDEILAIVGDSPPAWVHEAVSDDIPRPLVVAVAGEHGDIRVNDWGHAYDYLEDLCQTST